MPSVTRAELASTRKARPRRERDVQAAMPGRSWASQPSATSMHVFLAGKLVNPLNGSHGHWSKRAAYSRRARERAGLLLVSAPMPPTFHGRRASDPKLVVFHANVGAEWDDDNLRAALKPHRDALTDAGLINNDKPSSGHVFVYGQRVDRKNYGVSITVQLRPVDDVIAGLWK